jgi:hypothetical protein
VFQNQRVLTFNDEVACAQESCLSITAVIEALPLLEILRRLKETSLRVWHKGDKLKIKGKGGRVMEFKCDTEVQLPFDTVEVPKKWRRLRKGFLEALDLVQQCAGKDEAAFAQTCVHLTSTHIEASDNFQMSRHLIRTKLKKRTLVPRTSIKSISDLGVTHFSETENWLHFKNPTGLILSCRRYLDDYPVDIDKYMTVKGQKAILPKGLGAAADKAGVFSADNSEDNLVLVRIHHNRIIIKGEGDHGTYTQPLTGAGFEGELEFMIPPDVLIDITKHHNTVMLTDRALKIDTGNLQYLTRLNRITKGKK